MVIFVFYPRKKKKLQMNPLRLSFKLAIKRNQQYDFNEFLLSTMVAGFEAYNFGKCKFDLFPQLTTPNVLIVSIPDTSLYAYRVLYYKKGLFKKIFLSGSYTKIMLILQLHTKEEQFRYLKWGMFTADHLGQLGLSKKA